MKYLKVDAYDGMCFFGGLVFFAPVALLVRTQAGIIIGYSLAQMLAEPLIHLLGQCAKQKLTIFFCLLSGAVLVGFGLLHKPWILILMMAFLSLFLDLVAFYVEEQQNHLIDTLKMERDRAAALSVMMHCPS